MGADSLIVVDETRRRIVFLHVDGDSLTWMGDAALPFLARDLCTISDRLFVAGVHDSRILHEVTFEGEVANSFGGQEGPDPLSQALRSIGLIACSETLHALAFVAQMFGIVHVYSAEGDLMARDSVPDFVQTVYEVSGRSFRPTLPEEGYAHRVASVNWVGPDLLIQLSRGRRSDGVGREVRVRRSDGSWHVDLPEWPRILAVTEDTLMIGVVEDPYPRLLTFRVR